MTTEEMKALYEANPREWIVFCRSDETEWTRIHCPEWGARFYKLIHIKHKHILEAYLADNSAEIEKSVTIQRYEPTESMPNLKVRYIEYYTEYNFIENYNPELEYRLKEKEDVNFNSCSNNSNDSNNKDTTLNNFQKEKEDGKYNDTTDTVRNIHNPMADKKQVINNFQDYSFTADFEGEILKEIKVGDDCMATGRYMGWIRIGNNEMFMVEWWSDGMCRNYYKKLGDLKGYNLTPIKKHWWETIPENGVHMLFERNYESGIFNEIKKVMRYSSSKQHGVEDSDGNFWFVERFKLPTEEEEVMSLYYEGK